MILLIASRFVMGSQVVAYPLLLVAFPSRLAYHLLPFVLAGAFVLISALPSRAPLAGVLAFALAGFGCSALLLYGASAVVAVALGVLSLAVAHRRPSPRSLHQRPQPMTTSQPAPELSS